MFNGTLKKQATNTVDLKEKPISKTFHSIYYTVPKINKKIFQKELQCLFEISLSNTAHNSQYGMPIFRIPKKEGTASFITDHRKLTMKIVRRKYTLSRISNKIHQMEGLQYASELYLNMGYYTIYLSPESHNLTTIVTEFGKFRYNRAPTGL